MVPAGQPGRRRRSRATDPATTPTGRPTSGTLAPAPTRVRGVAVACAAGLLALAACQPRSGGTPPGPDRPGRSAPPVTVVLAYGSLGGYLTDADGMTLYLFQPDPPGRSSCVDACAQFWPPLLGLPTAGAGLSARDLSTTTRDDGSRQVVYRGHPLYYYAGDKKPGQITGQGVNANGGLWYLVDKAGNAITAVPTAPPGGR